MKKRVFLAAKDRQRPGLLTQMLKHKEIYLVMLPGILWYIIFAYLPLHGLSLAFKSYKANLGILGSPWVGFENYVYVFRDGAFLESVLRTIYINGGRLFFCFPFPIVLALMINELRLGTSKKVLQTIFTFPHFLSWVLVASMLTNILGQHGMVNSLLTLTGVPRINFLASNTMFLPLIYLSQLWKTSGYSAIIFLAALSGIDTEQYEAAEIDGASRLQRIWHISLPSIKGTIIVMFVLTVGNLMTAGFEQIFNLSNSAVFKTAEILDMYIYRVTFQAAADFSFSAAVSLIRSVINFVMLIAADRITRMAGGTGLFG
jgi:putative aldouronate transport system permease protein